jgi:signal transduction histidine kinase
MSTSVRSLLVTLIAADVAVFVVFGAYQLNRLFLLPLSETIPAIEAIAAGDLARRVPIGASEEFANLAASVNRMTDRLLDERLHLVRAEKLAGIGRFAAGIAHEVGNPLGAIHGYVHLIRKAAANNPVVLESAAALDAESARIDRIIRSLLDYARPRQTSPSPVDVNDTIRSVVSLLTDQGVLRHIDVQLALDAGHLATIGERHELEQVFVNLFINAADAMEGRGLIAVRSRRVTVAELAAYRAKLKSLRGLPGAVRAALEAFPATAHPMDVMRTGVTGVGCVETESQQAPLPA